MPKVGLDAYSLTGPEGRALCEPDVLSLLGAAKELEAEGLQTTLPDDPGQAHAAFALAEDLGLYLEPYIVLPVDWHGDAARIEARARSFHQTCALAATHGVRALHCSLGAGERFEDLSRWKEFVTLTAQCLQRLAPVLRDHGVCVGIENHWDFSTYEIRSIVERVGADVVGFGLDTGNLLALAEAPDRAIERAAPHTVTTHLKDAMLFSTARGAARPVLPIGQGQIGMAQVVHTLYRHNPDLHFTIEDHQGIWPVDYFEPAWLAAMPELTAHDIATTARLAREGDSWLAGHQVPDPRATELVPWSIQGPERLRTAILETRRMLHTAVAG